MSSGVFMAVPGIGVAERGTCRGCQAEMWWAKHPTTGKPHPYNADGTSHFATCPNAGEFRSQRKKTRSTIADATAPRSRVTGASTVADGTRGMTRGGLTALVRADE